jgi:DNA-binding response OmpR family regulator
MPHVQKTVLVVEDEVSLNNVICDQLRRKGYKVLNAFDGDSGIKTALENHPDAIVLDLMMPKLNGKEVLCELRNDSWGKNVPVIIATNLESIQDMNDCLAKDVRAYFIKTDISIESIVKTVELSLADT